MPSSSRPHRNRHRRRLSETRIRRLEGAALLIIAVLGNAIVTLAPSGTGARTQACLLCGPHPGADMVLNLALFLPFGAGLALLGTPWRGALAIGFGMTLIIEMLQLLLPLGRVASISDLAMNAAGTMIGFRLTVRRREILYPRSRSALRFAIAASAVWLAGLALTAVGLRASLPGRPYIGQLSPDLADFDNHTGRVVSANLSGVPLPDGPLAGAAPRTAMRTRTRLDAQAEFVAHRGGLAPVVRVVDDADQEIALLAQRHRDLLFRTRVLATNVGLVTPAVTMFDALASVDLINGQVILVAAERSNGRLRVSAYGRVTSLPLHSGVGWMFFARAGTALHRMPDIVSAGWVGLPLFAAGYWTGRRARRKARRSGDAFRLTGTAGEILRTLPWFGALTVVGLAVVSAALGLSMPGAIVWAGALIALGLGMAAGIATALSHDDRAHGLSRPSAPGSGAPERLSASGP